MENEYDEYTIELLDTLTGAVEVLTDDPDEAPKIARKLVKHLGQKVAEVDWTEYFEELNQKKKRFEQRSPFDEL